MWQRRKKKHEVSSISVNKWAYQLLNGKQENKLGQRSVLVLELVKKLGETWTLSIQSHSTSHSRSYFVTISSIWCHRQSTPASIILPLASTQHSNAYPTVLFVTIEIHYAQSIYKLITWFLHHKHIATDYQLTFSKN